MSVGHVYEFYDAEGSCLYVGCTTDFARRLRYHQWKQPWFSEVVRTVITMWPDVEAGLEAEALLIRTLNPRHNRALTGHDTPRRNPCRMCRQGLHPQCVGTNRDGDACPCGVCVEQRVSA